MKKSLTLIFGLLAAGTMFSLAQNEGDQKSERGGPRGERPGGPGAGRGISAELLEKYDLNKDGKLDDGERTKLREAMQAEREAAEKAADTNGDGTLDAAERKVMMIARLTPRFDANKDGKLDEEETAKLNAALARFGEGRPGGPRGEGRPGGPRGESRPGGDRPGGPRRGGDKEKAPEGGDKAPE